MQTAPLLLFDSILFFLQIIYREWEKRKKKHVSRPNLTPFYLSLTQVPSSRRLSAQSLCCCSNFHILLPSLGSLVHLQREIDNRPTCSTDEVYWVLMLDHKRENMLGREILLNDPPTTAERCFYAVAAVTVSCWHMALWWAPSLVFCTNTV